MICPNCGNTERFTKVVAHRCDTCANELPITDDTLYTLIRDLLLILPGAPGCGDADVKRVVPEQFLKGLK